MPSALSIGYFHLRILGTVLMYQHEWDFVFLKKHINVSTVWVSICS